MAGPKAVVVAVTGEQRARLMALARSQTRTYRLVQRARVVVFASRGCSNAAIARRLGLERRTVRKWRNAFDPSKIEASLEDRPRCGRPRRIPGWVRCEVVKLACARPDPKAQPFRATWTLDELQRAVVHQTGNAISRSEVCRTLLSHALKPHTVRMWLHSPDPAFRERVRRVCDLYGHPPKSATVLCIDEKTGMQALERIHPTRPAAPGRPGRLEFEYRRHGTRTLIAAFDPHTGKVFGHCRRKRRQKDLVAFMKALARHWPNGDVYVIWDNLNTHKNELWEQFNRDHGSRFHFVYTPKHASWLNQIELWFSVLQRRLLRHGSFASVEHLASQVLGFIRHWNAYEAHPFRWNFRGDWLTGDARAA